MAIDLPTLDDRSYEDLLAEALARIPSLAPEWTDHNASDPGIALVELIAWLTDMLMYRVGQIPDEVYETFLTLLNGRVRLPTADDISAAIERAPEESVLTTLTTTFGMPVEAARTALDGSEIASDAVNGEVSPAGVDRLAQSIGSLGSLLASGATGTLEARTRATILSLRDRYRAVTPADYEHLALEAWPRTRVGDALSVIVGLTPETAWSLLNGVGIKADATVSGVTAAQREDIRSALAAVEGLESGLAGTTAADMASVFGPDRGAVRARLVTRRNLYVLDLEQRAEPAPGHVTLVVVPGSGWRGEAPGEWAAAQTSPLTVALWKWLDSRRLLGTRHHVVLADVVPVRVKARLRVVDSVLPADVQPVAMQRIAAFLDPVAEGLDGAGWPFGRDVYLSEIYHLLGSVPGVDHVAHVELMSDDPDRLLAEPGAPAHALRLEPYELAQMASDEGDLDVR